MLQVAFRRMLVFTIGRCQTTDQDGVVTWNGIRHVKIRYVFTDRTADFMNNIGHRCYPIYLRTYSSLGHAKSDSILLVGVLVTLNDIPVSACTLLAGVFVTLNDIHLTTSTLLAGVSRKSFWTAYGVIWQTKVLPRLMSTPVNHWRESFTPHYIKHFVSGSITVCLLVLLTKQHYVCVYRDVFSMSDFGYES